MRDRTILESIYADLNIDYVDPTPQIEGLVKTYSDLHPEIPEEILNYMRLYDEFLLWYINLSICLNFHPFNKDIDDHNSYRVLSGAITSYMMSIRELVILGFDVSAKQILRSLSEHFEALLLLIYKPELAKEFATPDDWDASNRFWHKYIKGDKARRGAFSILGESVYKEDWYKDLKEHKVREETLLSLSSHPSYMGSVMATWQLNETDYNNPNPVGWPPFLGRPTISSVRTLKYAMYCSMFITAASHFPFGTMNGKSKLCHYDEKSEFCAHVKNNRLILMGILKSLSNSASSSQTA